MGLLQSAVKPRWREIAFHRNALCSLAISLAIWVAFGNVRLPAIAPSVKVLDATGPVLTFTAMGFAVSVTALALILALPLNRAVALMLVNTDSDEPVQISERGGKLMASDPRTNEVFRSIPTQTSTTGYLNLVFVFIWTAVANVWASLVAISAAVMVGNELLLSSESPAAHLIVAVIGGSLAYATLQMFAALLTIFQVAEFFQELSRYQLQVNAVQEDDGRL
jgi:hypothetical protein